MFDSFSQHESYTRNSTTKHQTTVLEKICLCVLTDDEAWHRLRRCRRKLCDAQQHVTDEETDHIVGLTPPVEHVMARRKQEASSQSGCKKYCTQSEADGVKGEPEVGGRCHGRAGQLAGSVEDVVVTCQDAWRF